MSRETYLPALFELFRKNGYDGVSLSMISKATGFGKASLYHHFPGGKAEMLQATLDYTQEWFEKNVTQVLDEDAPVRSRFNKMCDRLNSLYASGEQPCFIAALTAGGSRDTFSNQIKERLEGMVSAITQILTEEAGLPADLAHQRGEDAVIMIQGALILSHGTGNAAPFQRVIAQLPDYLCAGTAA